MVPASTSSSPGFDSSEKYVYPKESDLLPVLSGGRWYSKLWDSWDKPREERRFLLKLDLTLLSAASFGVLIKFIDQAAVNNAFLSGMKEDLDLYGNELNYAAAFFAAGYVFGQIPSNLILAKGIVKAHIWIPILEVLWTVTTFATSSVKTAGHLYACRLFLGLFEAGHFPAVMYVASSWYTPAELGKRLTLIQISVMVGPMFSGFLQAGIYSALNGVQSRAGWSWLFLIDGCISLPVSLIAFLFIPDLPFNITKSWLFTQEEIDLARVRKPLESYEKNPPLNWHVWRGILTTWHIWVFPTLFTFMGLCSNPSTSMGFWFKAWNTIKPHSYSVSQINIYPTPIYGVSVVYGLIGAWMSDSVLRGRRWPPIALAFCITFGVNIALATLPVYSQRKAVRWGLYYISNLVLGNFGVMWSWQAAATEGNPIKRAVVGATMNSMSTLINAWWPIVLFPTQNQPVVKAGNYATAGLSAGGLLLIPTILYLQRRDRQRSNQAEEQTEPDL
ncbi:uncharacterized protein I206_105733 [Kwoniella pini CBS 10737]|uniref:Major facilitator superfamily (MFS) profile domain-containing protein n=1 Tax=Kwoniella pini CBS 10737 TaxID=1296096 RepID=A0AAJ8L7T7_9TREE